MTKFYPNDTIARIGNIDDGKKIGDWNFFSYEGEFLYEVNYFDSIIVINDSVRFKSKGIITDYDSDGKKLYKGFIIEKTEKYDCAHTDHYEIRQISTIWEAHDSIGRMNGYAKNYYDNGVLQNEGYMKDGLPTGLWKFYDPYGKLNLMGSYHQGKRHGRWLAGDLSKKKYLGEICLNPDLPDLEEEIEYRENLLDVEITNYWLGKAKNRQFYDLNLNKFTEFKD
jgi:antitoxin component YwqK of YwqJK toxin-antitoxin module